MSHHLDSPSARSDVRLDISDLYVFHGTVGTAFAINVCHSIAGPTRIPGFHPEGRYEIKIDLDGDAVEDLTYRFTFGGRDIEGTQHFGLRRLAGGDAADPYAEGEALAHGRTNQIVPLSNGGRVWSGEAGDAFWNDLDVIHAVGHAFHDGVAIDLSQWDKAKSTNGFAGHTVYSIVLEVADRDLSTSQQSRRIGVWAVASLATDAGGWRPINRVGLPMISPILAQFDDNRSEQFNAGRPADDYAAHAEIVSTVVARVLEAQGTSMNPRDYANRFARRILPNILPYELGTEAGFDLLQWNGRTLTDDAPAVMCSMAANTPVATGANKDSVVPRPIASFPYVPPIA